MGYESVIDELVTEGYFSEYLPKEFTLRAPFDIFRLYKKLERDFAEPLTFNMSRYSKKQYRRTIYIPEITSYIIATNFMRDKNLFQDIFELCDLKNVHSFSPPITVSEDGIHLVTHEQSYEFSVAREQDDQVTNKSLYMENVIEKIKRSCGAKGILEIDISNFYLSIYTHLIPSIKLGYDEARKQFKKKTLRTDEYKTYDKLDEKVRCMNGNRTKGLLPGNQISRLLAEALLCRIDHELDGELTSHINDGSIPSDIRYVRFVDDYEIYIYDEDSIDKIKNIFEAVLNKYHLSINYEKLNYRKFPFYVIDNLREILIGYENRKWNSTELMNMFNAFISMLDNEREGAVDFLVKSLFSLRDSKEIAEEDHLLYYSYLFNILSNDHRSLRQVSRLLIKEKNMISDNAYFNNALPIIDNLLLQHLANGDDLESIWLLYLRSKLFPSKNLTEEILDKVAKSDNDLALILVIEEYQKFEIDNRQYYLDKAGRAESWLLIYQLFLRDYLTLADFERKGVIEKNINFYKNLKQREFSFYQKDH